MHLVPSANSHPEQTSESGGAYPHLPKKKSCLNCFFFLLQDVILFWPHTDLSDFQLLYLHEQGQWYKMSDFMWKYLNFHQVETPTGWF